MKTIVGQWANAANGTVRLELSKYAIVGGSTQNAPRYYQIPLDIGGSIPVGYQIWANDELLPEGTTYKRTVFDSYGYMLGSPETTWICGTAPISLTPDTTGAFGTALPPPPPPPVPIVVTVSPSNVPSLTTNLTQQFTATVTGTTNTNVTWTTTAGTIDQTGFFTAPNTAALVTITATSVVNPTAFGTATVSVFFGGTITIVISPRSGTLHSGQTLQFTAIVYNTANQAAIWSTSLGTISGTGLYTAPTVTGSSATVITAHAVAQTLAQDNVTITLLP